MSRLSAFQRVALQYADIADSLLVYIEEAHPSDGWVSSDAPYQIPRHRCLEDRLRAAELMNREAPGSAVVVDTMENVSNAAYGAYFERLYILLDDKVVYQGGRGPEGYRIAELRDWLERYRSERETVDTPVVLHWLAFAPVTEEPRHPPKLDPDTGESRQLRVTHKCRLFAERASGSHLETTEPFEWTMKLKHLDLDVRLND
ncbi:hypothetical protein DNTS_032551 [Danionella cerebrum]|uniref:Iodothyronine deiodinase n=1 Tax=Danionella cerebrum TaxID=2873325 RepID=A0A553R346_9TELE|nr:hypothetical protein DNTS_032551 [Danionella translucida]